MAKRRPGVWGRCPWCWELKRLGTFDSEGSPHTVCFGCSGRHRESWKPIRRKASRAKDGIGCILHSAVGEIDYCTLQERLSDLGASESAALCDDARAEAIVAENKEVVDAFKRGIDNFATRDEKVRRLVEAVERTIRMEEHTEKCACWEHGNEACDCFLHDLDSALSDLEAK